MTEEIGTSNLLRTWANDGTVVVPSNDKIDEGWLRGEQPPHEWMNYIHNVLGQKINHALSRGAADWNSTTLYLVGSLVRHDGRVWMSFVENSNSEPSSANADWSVLQDKQNTSVTESLDVTVGPSGDFATINEALEYLSQRQFAYQAFTEMHTITLVSGFEMDEQVVVRGMDLSGIQIVGEDSVHTIVRSSLSTEVAGVFAAFTAIQGGRLPIISQLFEMDTSGTATNRDGIRLEGAGSSVVVAAGAGVAKAGGDGFSARGGALFSLEGSIFSEAGKDGIASNGCYGTCAGADIQNAGRYGIFANNSASVSAFDADARFAGDQGVRARSGAVINFRNGTARKVSGTNGSDDIVVDSGGIISANSATGGLSQAANTVTSNGIIFS